MKRNLPPPTDAELEILGELWKHGPSTVRFINGQLNRKRPVGYTTTLKIMQIMHEKGLVSRTSEGRTHIYRAELKEEETQDHLIDKLLNTAFGGSTSRLVMQVLGKSKSTKEELEQIKKLIEKLEKRKS